MNKIKHYGYGSGLGGCLYDNGPHYAGTDKNEAAKASLFIFADDLTEEQHKEALDDLMSCGCHRFPREVRRAIGADIVKIFEVRPEDWSDEIEEGGIK